MSYSKGKVDFTYQGNEATIKYKLWKIGMNIIVYNEI